VSREGGRKSRDRWEKMRAVEEKKKWKENHMSGHRLDNISFPSPVYGY
jgi:hypothetical protein